MAEYKVTKVSTQPPREYYNEKYKSTTYYIKVALEGHNKPVTIGKKSPDALKAGDVVRGTIKPTEYDTDNFEADKEFGGGGGGKGFTKTDPKTMYVAYAKDVFVAMFEKDGKVDAKVFTTALEQIKAGGELLMAEQAANKSADTKPETKEEDAEVKALLDSADEVELDDIPF